MGLDKTAPKTWKLLKHAGLSVPRYRLFGRDEDHEVQEFARKCGFPVAISATSGAPRRAAADPEELTKALSTLRAKTQSQLVVSESVRGYTLKFLVHQEHVVAISEDGGQVIPLDAVSDSLKELAVAAVAAVPGIDTAGVRVVTPRQDEPQASKKAIVERVMHYPHLRDFAGGSVEEALALADAVVQAEARSLGMLLPAVVERGICSIRFRGVPSPADFASALAEFIGSLSDIKVLSGPEANHDGVTIKLEAAAADAALVITRALGGLSGGGSAHEVRSMSMD